MTGTWHFPLIIVDVMSEPFLMTQVFQEKITWKGERAEEYCNIISSESSREITALIDDLKIKRINESAFTVVGRKIPSGPCINKTERKYQCLV